MNGDAPYQSGMPGFHLLTQTASVTASHVDRMFFTMVILCGTVVVILATLITFFCVRYRHEAKVDRSEPATTGRGLEVAWTAVPLLLFLAIFVWSAKEFVTLYRPPADADTVFVVAKQWMWKLQHRNGRREIDELHVPLGRPVRLVMTSEDVIHSLYLPAFRIKQDVVPGRYTSLWFTPDRVGDFRLFCSEFCGSQHASMMGHVIVMPQKEFAQWLGGGSSTPGLAVRGFALFREHGCSGCHTVGSSVHAPDLDGLLGRTVHLQDGRTLVADEAYVRDSILLPQKDVVAGYAPIMPSFAGQLSEEDIFALIAYLRSDTSKFNPSDNSMRGANEQLPH